MSIKNSSSDHHHNNKEIGYVKTISGTSIRNRATNAKLDDIMLNQIEKGNRLSHEVINLALSFCMGKKETLGDLKILDWNGISSHKEEERIFGKFYISKKKNICFPERLK